MFGKPKKVIVGTGSFVELLNEAMTPKVMVERRVDDTHHLVIIWVSCVATYPIDEFIQEYIEDRYGGLIPIPQIYNLAEDIVVRFARDIVRHMDRKDNEPSNL